MKHFTHFKAWLMLCLFLIVGGGSSWAAIESGTYTLCTSTSDLQAGAHYIIASGTSGSVYCISNVTNANNRKIVSATVTDSKIEVASNSTIMTFTLGGSTGAWTFSTDNYAGTNGYLASASSGDNNYCRVISTSTTSTISFSSNAAVINLQPHTSRNILRFNSSSNLFACYSSGQSAVYLYKKVTTPSVACTVTFNAGSNGTCSTSSLTEASAGAGVTLPNVTANEGYIFKGWTTTSGATTVNAGTAGANYKPSSDCTLYAVYGNIYTVTLGDNAATLTQTTEGGNVTLPTREGNNTYTFAGWSLTNNTEETTIAPTIIPAGSYKPTANIKFFPVYKRVEGGGSTMVTQDYETASEPTGWSSNGISRTDGNDISPHGGSYWGSLSENGEAYIQYMTMLTGNVSVSAYVARTTKNSNQGEFKIQSKTSTGSWTDRATLDIKSSTVDEWQELSWTGALSAEHVRILYTGGTTAVRAIDDITISYSTGTTYYISVIANQYDVKFFVGGEEQTSLAQKVVENGNPTTVADPTKTGYTFDGWYEASDFSGDKIADVTSVTISANKNFYGRFNINNYTITYNNVEGATHSNPATYTIETATINLADASKDGFIFQGWFDNADFTGDAVTTIAQGSTGDKAFWAKWAEIPANPSVVTFNVGEHGTCDVTELTESEVGAGVALPAVTANEGWVFKGWSTENPATAETIVSAGDDGMYHILANTTLYAYYKVKPATPAFSSAAGAIEKGTEVTISCTTEGAAIYYTTNGDKPTAESTAYSEAITVSAAQTIKAIAILDGEQSEVASAEYTIATHTAQFSINGVITDANNCTVAKGEAITFPADPAVDGVVFMGWATATIDGTQNDAPTMYKSATMGMTGVTYYAVFATKSGDGSIATGTGLSATTSAQTLEQGKPITYKSSAANSYSNPVRIYKNGTFTIAGATMTQIVLEGDDDSNPATNLVLKSGEPGSISTGTNTVTWTGSATSVTFVASSAQARVKKITVTYGEPTYSDYCTTVSTKATPTLSFAEATYEATMGEEFDTPVLTMTEGISVTYSSSETGVATVNATTGKVTLVAAGTTIITATFAGNDDYKPATASYTLNVAAATPVFASLEELVAADLTSGTEVTVTFENVAIKAFQTVSSTRKGVYFDIQKGGNDIEIYYNGEVPAEWAVGGTLSGTLTNCPWKFYSGTWELAPESGWAWTNLTYNAPANYAPTFTTQPVSATYDWNASATNLKVEANGNPAPTYQWYSNTTNSNENGTVLTGETNASYKPSTATAGSFYYYCVATNSEGSVASDVAVITVNDPVVASLPFAFDGGKNDITSKDGMSQSGLGSDYNTSPKLKFDSQGDNVVIQYNEAAKKVTYTIKGNSTSGTYAFDVMESADGVDYTTVHSHTSVTDEASYTDNLASTSRFVKFVYTTKANGNVALGDISIIAASVLDDPEFDFEQSTYTFFTDKDMQVVATSAAGSTGAITYALTEGNEDEFLIDENTGEIACYTPGTYTVTATIAETAEFASATTTCTVKVLEPVVGNSIIVAETDGGCYAMTTTCDGSVFTYKAIKKAGDKYVVNSLDDILFCTHTSEGKTTIQSTSNAQYVQATAAKNISYTETEYQWTNNEGVLTAATENYGTLQYNTSSPRFTTYATKVGQYATIVDLENVYVGVLLDENDDHVESINDNYETVVVKRTIKADTWNTFCVPFDMNEEQITDNFGEAAEVKKLDGLNVSGTNFNMHFGDAESIEAGVPYMVRVQNPVSSIVVYNADVTTADNGEEYYRPTIVNDNGNSLTFHGNYTKQYADVGSFIISSNKFYYVDADAENYVTLKGFRGYITTETSGGDQVRALNFNFDELVTGISTNLNADQNNRIYNLQGMQQSKLQRGVNIVNGRKVIK